MTSSKTATLAMFAILGSCAAAFGQGVLVDVRVEHAVRLPRPIPIPRPRPEPPTATYKIDSIEVNADIKDQVRRSKFRRRSRTRAACSLKHASCFRCRTTARSIT